MMKLSSTFRAITASALLLLTGMAFAAPSITNKPYLGFGMGYANTDAHGGVAITGTGAGNTGTQTTGLSNANSFTGNIYAGDEVDVDNFSLALEAMIGGQTGANRGTATTVAGSTTAGSNSIKYSQPAFWGISLLPGYYITPKNHVYGRIGYLGSYAHTSNTQTIPTLGTGSGWVDNYASGYQLGLGYEYGITQHLFLRTEYDYQHYQRQLVNPGIAATGGGFTTASPMSSVEPTQNVVTVGLNYKF